MDWIITEIKFTLPAGYRPPGQQAADRQRLYRLPWTLEEFNKEQKTATIVSGLYDQVGDQWREPINLPNGGFVQVIYQGVPLHALN